MKPHGTYKIANRGHALGALIDPLTRSELRSQRILRSLRDEIGGLPGGAGGQGAGLPGSNLQQELVQ